MLQIGSYDEFRLLLEGLAADVVEARIHVKLYADLNDAIPEFERELSQAPAFWSLTISAHWFAALGRLIRVYDPEPKAVSLVNVIDTILESPALSQLRAALALPRTRDAGSPPVADLHAERFHASDKDPLVRKLVAYRGNILAHRNAKNVISKGDLEQRFGMSHLDVQELLERAHALLNTYGQNHFGTTWSPQIVGHDDFVTVLKSVRTSIVADEQGISDEMEALLRKKAT